MNQIVASLVMEASTGNVQAANALLDRMLGKVPQAVQHQGETGGPLEIIVRYATKKPIEDALPGGEYANN